LGAAERQSSSFGAVIGTTCSRARQSPACSSKRMEEAGGMAITRSIPSSPGSSYTRPPFLRQISQNCSNWLNQPHRRPAHSQAAPGSDGILLGNRHPTASSIALDEQPDLSAREQVVPNHCPNMSLDDVQPGAQKRSSSSWMILPLRAPGRPVAANCNSQPQTRLSRFSRDASVSEPSVFRLVRFAVTDKAPDLWFLRPFGQTARLEIAIKSRLVNGQKPGQGPWRTVGKLPELRHQIRMRIRRQPAAVGEFPGRKFCRCFSSKRPSRNAPRINARRGVTLKINHVAGKILRASAEKVIEPNLVKALPPRRRSRCGRRTLVVELALTTIAMAFQRM